METNNGGLFFEAGMDNEKLKAGIEETIRRIQGLSDASVKGGKAMDEVFDKVSADITSSFEKIDFIVNEHKDSIKELEKEYRQIGLANRGMSIELGSGGYLTERQQAIAKEVRMRKALIKEVEEAADKLHEEEIAFGKLRKKVEENANAHQSLRSRMRELKEDMASMIDQGINEQSEAYKALTAELGRLQDIQDDIAQQGKVLANDESSFQGVIAGLSGLAGGFSAATGAMSLFASENENLQAVMAKIQSVMAITIGMQQVSQALNKDNAFQLITLNDLKKWWAGIVEKATAAETAEAVATQLNTSAKKQNAIAAGSAAAAETIDTTAKGANTAAATSGAVANFTLAGAFRAVGLAIKSIPVFGWIIAGITLLIGVVSHFSNKAKQAREEQARLVEQHYRSIGAINELSEKWRRLGDDMEAKKRFVTENAEEFKKYNLVINDTIDAQRALIDNKDEFVAAQIAKAQSLALLESDPYQKAMQKSLEAKLDLERATKEWNATVGKQTGRKASQMEDFRYTMKDGKIDSYTAPNASRDMLEAMRQAKEAESEMQKLYGISEDLRKKHNQKMDDLNREAIEKSKNTVAGKKAFLEQELKDFETQRGQLLATDTKAIAEYDKKIRAKRAEIDKLDVTNKRASDTSTKETGSEMLDEFRASLSKRMDEARTVLEMIDIIKKERQSIEGDSSDIGKQKQKVLNDKEQDVLKQAKQETVKLMQNYESYIDAKISMDREYSDDLALLERARAEASTDAERQSIDRSIALRKRQYEKDKKGSGDERYDEMLSAYGSFEQKKLAIMQEYEEKRTKAQEHGNNEMIAKLNEAQARAISSLATEELMNTDVWSNLFGNLDELTSKQIGTLVVEIERNFKTLSGVFNPVDLAKIRNKLNEAREILIRDNPFKSMGESLKAVFNEAGDASKDSAQDIKRNWKRLAESTENSFDFVKEAINSADFLKDAIGDVGATAIGSMQAIVAVAITVAAAMNTVESASVVLVIIKAALVAVQAVVSVVKSIVGSADKQIEKSIQRHAEAAERLKNTYEDLKRAIQDALGSSVYEHQKAAIENLKLQQQNLQARIAAEKMKKKPDRNKIKEYEDQYRQAGYEIKDIIKDVTNDVLQTDAKTLADDLGDALVNAFARGEDAAKSLKKTTEDVIRNIVVNQLKKQFLEKQLGGALDKLYKSAGGKEGGVFSFNDLTDEALKSFENDVKNIANGFTEGMKRVSKIIKTANESPEVSLSGAVKGVTEETASMVAGQMNAIRINQMEATNMLRQQLFHLSNIDRNTGSIDKNTKYIKAIYDKISSGDTLRAKGLQ